MSLIGSMSGQYWTKHERAAQTPQVWAALDAAAKTYIVLCTSGVLYYVQTKQANSRECGLAVFQPNSFGTPGLAEDARDVILLPYSLSVRQLA